MRAYFLEARLDCNVLILPISANPSTCDINIQQGKSKNTFLHAACKSEKISDDILLDLINFPGTNVEVKNADNTTPLHYFCESNASVEGICSVLLFLVSACSRLRRRL
jgi:hypothetical protein